MPLNCPLAVGENVIAVTVTAADNGVKVYTVAVSRATDGTLTDLTLGAAPIYPQPFVSTTLAFTAAVSMATFETTVLPTTTFASDLVTVTALPVDHAAPDSRALLVEAGIYMIEFNNLAEPAADQAYEGILAVAPLKVTGATGSPVNPIFIA